MAQADAPSGVYQCTARGENLMKKFPVILAVLAIFPVATASADTVSYQNFAFGVPEPGSMLILGLGLFGLAWAARRRTRGV